MPILELKDTSLLLLHEDVGESYDAVARSAAAAVGADACHLALYDAEAEEMIARRPRYTAPPRPLPRYRFPLDSSPASARVIRSGQPHLSNEPARDPLYDPTVAERGVGSVLTVPVRREARTLGLLYALNKPGGFTEEDVQTLTALAGAAAVTLENIHLYARERERRVLNESLHEVSRALVGTLSEDAALLTVLEQMARVVTYCAATAVVVEPDGLRVAASRGGEINRLVPHAAFAVLMETLQAGRTRELEDSTELLSELGIEGFRGKALAAPLVAKGHVLGAVVVAFDADHPPGPAEHNLVSAFADHAALFLEAGVVLRGEREERARATAVARITRMSATRQKAEALMRAVAPELMALADADRAILYLRDESTGVLTVAAHAGTEPGEEERVRAHRLDGAEDDPLREARQPLLFERGSNPLPPRLSPFPDAQALLLIPLVSHDETLGAVALACVGRPRKFDPALVEFMHDVSQHVALGVENARLFDRLAQMAVTDDLTRLANRRKFTEGLRVELARSRRTGEPLSLIMADVDQLKRINDTLGHPAGDAAIRHVAEAFRRGRRETDLAARLGGEEFALILPGTDLTGGIQAAERIRCELAESSVPEAGTVTVSLGVATCPGDACEEEDLIRSADGRLYAAKAGGRNRVCYASPPRAAASSGFTPRAPGAEV